MNCIKCSHVLMPIFPESPEQPNHGVMCITSGNYGSRVYDSLDHRYLLFWLCDPCLEKAMQTGHTVEKGGRE